MMPEIRRGEPRDLEAIAAIQHACPQAAQWDVVGYLRYELLVFADGSRIQGFLVSRTVRGECEILNLAVSPEFRRQGVARRLIESLRAGFHGAIFLEVRESNHDARKFYIHMGFQEIARRSAYYHAPSEAAIVMKFHSC
jgi:ribosomal-protein-alanine N-acetyltransferase